MTWTQQSGTYGTDGEGYLRLNGNEKAVFKNVPNASRIQVDMRKNLPYWEHETGIDCFS